MVLSLRLHKGYTLTPPEWLSLLNHERPSQPIVPNLYSPSLMTQSHIDQLILQIAEDWFLLVADGQRFRGHYAQLSSELLPPPINHLTDSIDVVLIARVFCVLCITYNISS